MTHDNTILYHITTLSRDMNLNDLPPLIVENRNSGQAIPGNSPLSRSIGHGDDHTPKRKILCPGRRLLPIT